MEATGKGGEAGTRHEHQVFGVLFTIPFHALNGVVTDIIQWTQYRIGLLQNRPKSLPAFLFTSIVMDESPIISLNQGAIMLAQTGTPTDHEDAPPAQV